MPVKVQVAMYTKLSEMTSHVSMIWGNNKCIADDNKI